VRSILLDIESPGGEAVGAFEAADAIRAAAKLKPVTAVVNGMAASAAYALASARQDRHHADRLAGSIGVVMLHADYSRFLDAEGVTPTLIFAGATRSTAIRSSRCRMRCAPTCRPRSTISTRCSSRRSPRAARAVAAAIRGTEARTFLGKDAVDRGLADSVGTFESALADISRGLARTMSIPTKGKKWTRPKVHPPPTRAFHCRSQAAVTKARPKAAAEAGKAAQARIKSILGSDEAKGRTEMANHLAFETDMSAEASIALLAKSPKGEAPKAAPSIAGAAGPGAGRCRPASVRQQDRAADLNPSAIYESRRKAVGK
jgi:ClpP class serine protease